VEKDRTTHSIDVEGDLDLGDTLVRRGDTRELEVSEELAVSNHGSLSLVDLDLDSGLTVGGGGESLGLLGRDGGVSGDEGGHDSSEGLDTWREGKKRAERRRGQLELPLERNRARELDVETYRGREE